MMGEISWYNDPFFVALIVVILTLVTSRVAGRLESRARRKEQAAMLRIAFAAEIDTIVQNLEPVLRDLLSAWKKGESWASRELVLPCTVYEANVSRIGEIGDKQLVHFLVVAYSHLRELTGRGVQEGSNSEPRESPLSLASLLSAWQFAVAAHSILRQTTHDTVPRRTEPLISQEDADRLNLTVDFVNDLLHDAGQRPREFASSIERIREKYPRAYDRWDIDEDERLQKEFKDGRSVKELSDLFERQPSAIRSRLNKLGLT